MTLRERRTVRPDVGQLSYQRVSSTNGIRVVRTRRTSADVEVGDKNPSVQVGIIPKWKRWVNRAREPIDLARSLARSRGESRVPGIKFKHSRARFNRRALSVAELARGCNGKGPCAE